MKVYRTLYWRTYRFKLLIEIGKNPKDTKVRIVDYDADRDYLDR